MAVIVIVEDGIIEIIEWRWDVRVIWKDTLVFVKMRSMPPSEKDLSLSPLRHAVFCAESGICRQSPKSVMWGTRQHGIRALKLKHVLQL